MTFEEASSRIELGGDLVTVITREATTKTSLDTPPFQLRESIQQIPDLLFQGL
jgi:hypothetical protein